MTRQICTTHDNGVCLLSLKNNIVSSGAWCGCIISGTNHSSSTDSGINRSSSALILVTERVAVAGVVAAMIMTSVVVTAVVSVTALVGIISSDSGVVVLIMATLVLAIGYVKNDSADVISSISGDNNSNVSGISRY